jgi:hypothetical protein
MGVAGLRLTRFGELIRIRGVDTYGTRQGISGTDPVKGPDAG